MNSITIDSVMYAHVYEHLAVAVVNNMVDKQHPLHGICDYTRPENNVCKLPYVALLPSITRKKKSWKTYVKSVFKMCDNTPKITRDIVVASGNNLEFSRYVDLMCNVFANRSYSRSIVFHPNIDYTYAYTRMKKYICFSMNRRLSQLRSFSQGVIHQLLLNNVFSPNPTTVSRLIHHVSFLKPKELVIDYTVSNKSMRLHIGHQLDYTRSIVAHFLLHVPVYIGTATFVINDESFSLSSPTLYMLRDEIKTRVKTSIKFKGIYYINGVWKIVLE